MKPDLEIEKLKKKQKDITKVTNRYIRMKLNRQLRNIFGIKLSTMVNCKNR